MIKSPSIELAQKFHSLSYVLLLLLLWKSKTFRPVEFVRYAFLIKRKAIYWRFPFINCLSFEFGYWLGTGYQHFGGDHHEFQASNLNITHSAIADPNQSYSNNIEKNQKTMCIWQSTRWDREVIPLEIQSESHQPQSMFLQKSGTKIENDSQSSKVIFNPFSLPYELWFVAKGLGFWFSWRDPCEPSTNNDMCHLWYKHYGIRIPMSTICYKCLQKHYICYEIRDESMNKRLQLFMYVRRKKNETKQRRKNK